MVCVEVGDVHGIYVGCTEPEWLECEPGVGPAVYKEMFTVLDDQEV